MISIVTDLLQSHNLVSELKSHDLVYKLTVTIWFVNLLSHDMVYELENSQLDSRTWEVMICFINLESHNLVHELGNPQSGS